MNILDRTPPVIRKVDVHAIRVYMGAKEYASKIPMERLAVKAAMKIAERPLVVEVHEHGGWFLQYWFGTSPAALQPVIVGTANDTAVFSNLQVSIRKIILEANIVWRQEIRRP